jgi:hypothetical protein
LRQIARGITDRFTPQEAVILLVDYRRTMLGFLSGDSLLGYAVSRLDGKPVVIAETDPIKGRPSDAFLKQVADVADVLPPL